MSHIPQFDVSRRHLLWAGLLGLCMAGPASAQSYPANVIRIVVPAVAGTPPDIISRLIADELAAAEGWSLIVENRPGALQTIAMSDVGKRPSDGYSLLTMSVPMMVTPALRPNLEIKPDVHFAPVIKISQSYTVLVTSPSLAVDSLPDLVALMRSKPGQLNFSSGGIGTPSHLIGEMFQRQARVRATHVPYQQLPQAIADLINGTNQFMFITTLPVIDLAASGKLRALAVTAPRRIAALANVPSVAEVGFPGLVTADWVGFAVKRDTSVEIAAQLNNAINRVLAQPKIRTALEKIGAEPAGGSAAEFGDAIRGEVAHWAKVVQDANVTLPQ